MIGEIGNPDESRRRIFIAVDGCGQALDLKNWGNRTSRLL
jgi:hypothetical protein